MKPFLIPSAVGSDFTEAKPIASKVGVESPQACFAHNSINSEEGISTGIWRCSKGSFMREVTQAEFSYFIEGEGTFKPDNSDPIKFRSGDSVYFPKNTKGVWEIISPVTKSYIIFG